MSRTHGNALYKKIKEFKDSKEGFCLSDPQIDEMAEVVIQSYTGNGHTNLLAIF